MGGVPEEKKPVGPMIGIVIVVIVLIAGAVYAFLNFKQSVGEQPGVMKQEVDPGMMSGETSLVPDATVTALSEQGASIDLSEIQKDLQATDLSGLDAGLSDISASL